MAGDTISFARGAPSLDIVDVDGLRESAARAFERDPGGTTAYGTSVGYVPLRKWIAEQHGVADEQVLVTNGSMQADAFLFDELVHDGDAVVVEKPTYDRTLLGLKERGASIKMVGLEPDGIDVEELRHALAEGLRPKLAHIIPNFQNPAGYTLSAPSATSCCTSPATTTSCSSRTIRTSPCGSPARRCRRCCRSTTASASSTPPRSRRPSAPASASATSSGPPI
jgi:DNA-binding transcriptional MocR family regulator